VTYSILSLDSILIHMFTKATELQELWKPAAGDQYVFNYRKTTGESREFEKAIWGDSDSTWLKVEILCYKPSDVGGRFWISTGGETSHVMSAVDLIRKNCVWLPSDEQLWNIIRQSRDQDRNTPFLPYIWGFARFCGTEVKEAEGRSNKHLMKANIRVLLLAYTMHLVYKKVWNGKDWIAREQNAADQNA
jgi:hypothetical protein